MKNLKNINTIVFDCDGVMFQTEELNRKYYNTLLEKFGLPPMTKSETEFVKMHTADDSINHIFQDKVDRTEVDKERKKLPYIDFVPYMEMTNDLIKLLKYLLKQGYNTAIATNRSNTMDKVMDLFELNQYFNIVVTASDVEKAKPDPEQLFKIRDFFKVKSENMIYIGDSSLDEQAAQSADIYFAAFRNPELTADFYAEKMMEIKNLLTGD
ncbi:MAG: HAD family hydrolase [Thermodesulfobacteriota bacterium]